ncbi:MAG: FUSC family protein [Rhodocyclaceae bacterium]
MPISALARWGLDRAALWQALRLAGAAWLAFALAAFLHLHNAYWAAMPVWVVAQTSRGLLLERAFFRVVGTLAGAAVGFAILQLPLGPYGQIVALGLVVAVAGGLTHILRGVHAYGALMVGMTAGVVVLPSALAPAQSLALAAARVECTLIGVVVVTLVMGLFTPGSRRDAFYARVRALAADAVDFAAGAIAVPASARASEDERRLLAEMSDVDALASMVSAGSVEGYKRLRHVDALLGASMAVMAAGRALRVRALRGETSPQHMADSLRLLAARLRAASSEDVTLTVPDTPEARRLADAVNHLLSAEAALFGDSEQADAQSFRRKAAYLAPHRDWLLARRTGAVAGVATVAAGCIAYAVGHPAAELTAMGVCIFSMVLGAMPVPQRMAPHMFRGVVVGVLAATFYRFAIQPGLDSTLALALSVAPFMAAGALMRVHPRTTIAAVDANMCFMLASQAGMPAAAAGEITLGALALLLGAALVMGGFVVLPRRADLHARAAAETLLRDLERLVAAPAEAMTGAWQAHNARQILRLMLHLGRAGGQLGEAAPAGLLASLNLAHAIAALQAHAGDTWQGAQALNSLTALTGLRHDAGAVAAALWQQAAALEAGPVRHAIEMAADATEAVRPLAAFAHG